jgi:aspartyl-tRNA(Asn)/glutamyl-tRNA(Gln) amidotransferase subunit C
MSISQEQIQHVARLARLKLSAQEAVQFTEQINDILQFVEKLNELDTEQVEATSHVLPITNVMRDDIVQPSLDREVALANAPEKQEGMFRVPPVLED